MSAAVSAIPLPGSIIRAATAPTIVTSRPSRIHTAPRPITIRQWNRDHGSRSSRAGIAVRKISGPELSTRINLLRLAGTHRGFFEPAGPTSTDPAAQSFTRSFDPSAQRRSPGTTPTLANSWWMPWSRMKVEPDTGLITSALTPAAGAEPSDAAVGIELLTDEPDPTVRPA